jgi:C4-dicarboxylate-specific signal transduction histidine kinase
MKNNTSIRNVLINNSILMLLLTIIVITSFTTYLVYNNNQNTFHTFNEDILSSINREVDTFLELTSRTLDEINLSLSEMSTYDMAQKQEYLENVRKINKEIVNIYILDDDGRLVINSPYEAEFINSDYSLRNFFTLLNNVDDTYWSDVFTSYSSRFPLVTVSKKFNNHVIVLTLNLESLNELLQDFKSSPNSIIAITDSFGTYIAHTDANKIYTRSHDPHVSDYLTKNNKYFEYEGNRVKGLFKAVNNTNWKIILYQSNADFYSVIIRMLASIIISTVIILAISLYINASTVKKVIQDFNYILLGANKVSNGDYEYIETNFLLKELNEFKEHFNTMTNAVKLRESQLEESKKEISNANHNLEKLVEMRTKELHQKNKELETNLSNLRLAQNRLITSEKLASLGELVSGIAHELNTPIGVSVTTQSYLGKEMNKFNSKLSNNTLTKNDMIKFLKVLDECHVIIDNNLKRASELISSFKKVAVDQQNQVKNKSNFKDIIDATTNSMGIELKRKHIELITSYNNIKTCNVETGAISQILTNLIQNSIIHGFKNIEYQKEIKIDFEIRENTAYLTYSDNGKGIRSDLIPKIFDPFFTTNRNNGGTGLGLNVIYNIVVNVLKGEIHVENLEKGVQFQIVFDVQAI